MNSNIEIEENNLKNYMKTKSKYQFYFKQIRFKSKINQANISYIIVASDEKVLRAIKRKNTSIFVPSLTVSLNKSANKLNKVFISSR